MHPIAQYRAARGFTQAALADHLGVSLNSVQRWEAGAKPRPTHLAKLAAALGIDALGLLREIEAWRSAPAA